MAQLFFRCEEAGGWGVIRAGASPLVLSTANGRAIAMGGQDGAQLSRTMAGQEAAEQWVLTGGGQKPVYVNGERVVTGVCVLRDRDEILYGVSRVFFSTERLPQVQPFPGAEQPIACARCRQVVVAGSLTVQCAGANCGLWFHQTEELPCWTGYSSQRFKTCAMCDCPAVLYPDADFRWTPEGL